VLGRCHHEDSFYVGGQLPIEVGHGELVLEVGDRPQSFEDDGRVPAARKIDDELVEARDDDVRVVGERVAQERFALVRGEQRLFAHGLLDQPDDDTAELARTAGYVVAPIVQGGQTIGLLHADRLFSGEEITEFDRDLLWTFATGVGWAMRQAVAIERHAPAAVQAPAVEEGLADLVREWAAAPGGWAHESRGPDAQLDEAIVSLTARERDVLELMAGGASNAATKRRDSSALSTMRSRVSMVCSAALRASATMKLPTDCPARAAA